MSRVISALDTLLGGVYVHHNSLILKDTVDTGMHSQCFQVAVMFDHLIDSMEVILLSSRTSQAPGSQLGS